MIRNNSQNIYIKGRVFSSCWIIPAMAPTLTPTGSPDPSAALSQASRTLSTSQANRPLRREGAVILLSTAEQALEDAMLRSSPPPESVLGKRSHEQDDEHEAGDTEPEDVTPSPATQSPAPSVGNVTAATLRYATCKKLRAEQRDELELFLNVRTPSIYLGPSV